VTSVAQSRRNLGSPLHNVPHNSLSLTSEASGFALIDVLQLSPRLDINIAWPTLASRRK